MRKPRGKFLNFSAVGAASELIACADLMAKGYHVYRCESLSAPFDLVAYNGDGLLRVEVKTISGLDISPSIAWPTNDEWDVLIAVGPLGCLYFDPEMSVREVRDAVRVAYGFAPAKTPDDLRHPCGTEAAYRRHRIQQEPACEPCRVANRTAWRTRQERRKQRELAD